MGSIEEDEEEEALSDFDDDATPVVLPSSAPVPSITAESLNSLLSELESEKQARRMAESAKNDLQSSLSRLKASNQEALRHKEETAKLKEELTIQLMEALQRKDEIAKERDQIVKERDEALKEKDEIQRQKDEIGKAREASRAEIETAARLLISGAEKITSKASKVKSFTGVLPRSSTHTGVAAIAYGFSKRAEEIVEEVVRQHEIAVKNKVDMREQMEQRNYRTAIEISQLEASVQDVKSKLSQKSEEVVQWQKLVASKDNRISEIEHEMSEKLGSAAKERETLKKVGQEAEMKVKVIESRIERIKLLVAELSRFISKGKEALAGLSASFSFQTQTQATFELADSPISSDPEEGIQECLIMAKGLSDLCLRIGMTWKEHQELWEKEREDLEDTVRRLLKEKQTIISLLKSALVDRDEALEAVSKSQIDGSQGTVLLQSDSLERGLTISKESFGMDGVDKDIDLASRIDGLLVDELKTGEAISMASALENEVKNLRQEIFELHQTLATARAETNWLRVTCENQEKELTEKVAIIHGLEENEGALERQVEFLKAELAAAEEETKRWKHAATEEAAAGSAVMQELQSSQEEIVAFKQHVAQLNRSLEEAENKLRSKEEMAAAAITARNAAERSLRIADERAGELRERIEELSRQLEELEGKGDLGSHIGWAELCWPWHWFRGRSHFNLNEPEVRAAAEMEELLDPLI